MLLYSSVGKISTCYILFLNWICLDTLLSSHSDGISYITHICFKNSRCIYKKDLSRGILFFHTVFVYCILNQKFSVPWDPRIIKCHLLQRIWTLLSDIYSPVPAPILLVLFYLFYSSNITFLCEHCKPLLLQHSSWGRFFVNDLNEYL